MFDYAQAYARNIGLLTADEQARLRQATIALPGLGGVGGAHLLTLSRLGFERFVLADGDHFELPNFNRQAGATVSTLGRPKTDVLIEMARAINPGLSVRCVGEPVHAGNVAAFLEGVDVVVDGLDFFAMQARRLLFRTAHERRVPVITCGPLGFSVAMLIFMPDSPGLDDYLGIHDAMDEIEQLARFAVGLAPAGLHLPYLDRGSVSLRQRRGPSSIIAVNLCAAVAAMETVNLVLKRRPVPAVPKFSQFDAYRGRFVQGTLRGGNRHVLQRAKLWYLKRKLRDDFAPPEAAAAGPSP